MKAENTTKKPLTPQQAIWVKDVLCNVEETSPEELKEQFVDEFDITEEQADYWISKRSFYACNMIMNDGTGDSKDVGVFIPGKGECDLKEARFYQTEYEGE